MSTRVSPDGMYYWDGQAWVSTLSHDGRHRWNGAAWVPVGAVVAYSPRPAVKREPTKWTRPLQVAVIAYYVWSAIYTLSIPLWMGPIMAQAMNQAFQRQAATSGEPMPPGFADSMASMISGALWFSAVIGLVIAVAAIVAALRRWIWAYYVILVLFGFGLLSVPVDLGYALGGSALSTLQGFSMPAWTYWLGATSGLVVGALFICMLIALIRIGPWAMRKIS